MDKSVCINLYFLQKYGNLNVGSLGHIDEIKACIYISNSAISNTSYLLSQQNNRTRWDIIVSLAISTTCLISCTYYKYMYNKNLPKRISSILFSTRVGLLYSNIWSIYLFALKLSYHVPHFILGHITVHMDKSIILDDISLQNLEYI